MKMSDEQLMFGMVIFLMLSMHDKSDNRGKRGRKAISKAVKKAILQDIAGNRGDEAMVMTTGSQLVLMKAMGDMDSDVELNPGAVFALAKMRYPDLIDPYHLKEDHMASIIKAYSGVGNSFFTAKFTNRVIERMREFLACMNDGKLDSDECWVKKVKEELDAKRQ